MCNSKTARRALWLKPWSVDPSKNKPVATFLMDVKTLLEISWTQQPVGLLVGKVAQDRNTKRKFAIQQAEILEEVGKGQRATLLKAAKSKATTSLRAGLTRSLLTLLGGGVDR